MFMPILNTYFFTNPLSSLDWQKKLVAQQSIHTIMLL